MDGTLTSTTTLRQSGPGSNGNEGVNPQSIDLYDRSLIMKCSFVSFPGYSLGGTYSSTDMR